MAVEFVRLSYLYTKKIDSISFDKLVDESYTIEW